MREGQKLLLSFGEIMNKLYYSKAQFGECIYVYREEMPSTMSNGVYPSNYCYVYYNKIEDYNDEPKKWYTYLNWKSVFQEIEISPVIAAFYGIEDLCQK